MNVLWNTTFENETVVIDGKHLIDCTLLNCSLDYSGGSVILERTELRGCHYIFRDQAQRTVRPPEALGLNAKRNSLSWCTNASELL